MERIPAGNFDWPEVRGGRSPAQPLRFQNFGIPTHLLAERTGLASVQRFSEDATVEQEIDCK